MVNGGSHKVSDLVSLWSVPVGHRAKIEKIFGGREFARRLQGLGLREGMTVEVLQHRGRGVVVAHGGTRIALGQGVADKLLVVTE